jgi:peptidoglycan hydrolase CwlO-like protein
MAPVSHPVLDDAEAGEEEQEWTVECNELLGQVLETQSEIASLLKAHDDTQQSLASLKRQCDDEVSSLGIFGAV